MKLTGKIIVGQGRGQGLSVPTLNLDQHPEDLLHGVYAVWVDFDGKRHPGAMNWGPRPTFQELDPVMEIHLLDFKGDLYGREVQVEVVQHLRDVQSFENKSALVEQIEKDVAACRDLLL